MSALATAVSRRPRWEYDPETDCAYLSTGTGRDELANPTGPWGFVSHKEDGPYRGYHWRAGLAGESHRSPLGQGRCPAPDAALDAAERAVDAVVTR